MPKILVVDDEPHYRDYLQRLLAADRHEVRTASSGREGIDIGARFRPEILVVDWMLRDDLHGLHVAAALRAVKPDLRAILITGFPSEDLKKSAESAVFSDFIEKPFETEEIREAVRIAASREPRLLYEASFGVLEIDGAGAVLYASPRARALLGPTRLGGTATRLEDWIDPADLFHLDGAAGQWRVVRSRGKEALRWRARVSRPNDTGSRLVVFVLEGQKGHRSLIDTLLDVSEAGGLRWSIKGRVLVVDDEPMVRRATAELIAQTGATCLTAASHVEALRLVQSDPGIGLVLLDYAMPRSDVGELVSKIRTLRPDVTLVGHSGHDRREEFAEKGVGRFVQKPWRLQDLLAALED